LLLFDVFNGISPGRRIAVVHESRLSVESIAQDAAKASYALVTARYKLAGAWKNKQRFC